MTSLETDWPAGATGIARDADTAARPKPMANTDIAIIFMDVPFGWVRRQITIANYANNVA
jgi:hypothetical protein